MKNFCHSYSYYFRILVRTREQLFWCLLFPILLSTMFRFAFSGFADSENFSSVPVAVSSAYELPESMKTEMQDRFKELLDITWTGSQEDSEKLLRDKKVSGALRLNSDLSLGLTVHPGSSMEASILEVFADNFNLLRKSLIQSAREDGIVGVFRTFQAMPKDTESYVKEASGTSVSQEGTAAGENETASAVSTDLAKVNFYSLIGMFCIFAGMAGFEAVIMSQANLSSLGLRISLTSSSHLQVLGGFLAAGFTVQYLCILIGLAYMDLILKVGFGRNVFPLLLITAAGCLSGTCLGFLIGSIGRMKETAKNAVLMVIVFGCSAAAGLFGGNNFIEIEHSAPFFNRINPVTLITDALYATALNGGPSRYLRDIGFLMVVSAVLFAGGIFLQRRKVFDSL